MPFPNGTPQNVGDNLGLKFGPNHTIMGPKGTVTRFSVFSWSIPALIAYANYIVQFGANVDLVGTDGGEMREMTVELPGLSAQTQGVLSELFFDQWELLTNEMSDTIFADTQLTATRPGANYPILNYNDRVVLSRIDRTGLAIADAVKQCNDDITNGNLLPPLVGPGPRGGGAPNNGVPGTVGTFQAPGLNSPLDAYGGTAPGQIYHELKKGQNQYGAPNYVLRHTSYCSPGALYNTSIAHTEQIYTPAALLSEISSGWTYNCPVRLRSKIAQIPIQYPAAEESPYYTWGWLKHITRETQMANFMMEVNSEFELALWSNLRYAIR